jgi:glutamate dehydrogenase (NADP+)
MRGFWIRKCCSICIEEVCHAFVHACLEDFFCFQLLTFCPILSLLYRLLELGAKVITLNDSTGVLVFENGMSQDDLRIIEECKNKKRARLSTIADRISGKYIAGESPWSINVKYDIALPCATQNEINEDGAKCLVANGVMAVVEGANLPTNMEAQQVLRDSNILYVPGKAANAGGVGVSGLEMSQNAQRLTWKPEKVDSMLQEMMSNIYDQMDAAKPSSGGTLEAGANRAGFLKVVAALGELGWFY